MSEWYEQFQSDHPGCTHETAFYAVRTYSNGSLHYVVQCRTCGRTIKELRKVDAQALERQGVMFVEWDEGLRDRYWEERSAIQQTYYRQNRADEGREWWDRYNDYLQSERWKQKRLARLRLDQGLCQARLQGCDRRAIQVHHLTYKHLGDEPLFELVSVCKPCHDRLTAMDRGEAAPKHAASKVTVEFGGTKPTSLRDRVQGQLDAD